MQVVESTLVLSPSDISGYLACPHLTTLSVAVARGELVRADARRNARRHGTA
jgi:hypothetical protein